MKRAIFSCLALLAAHHLFAGTVYQNDAAFLSAVQGPTSTEDFEAVSTGTTIPSGSALHGITYSYSLGGLNLAVTSVFNTVSGTNYLGVDNPGNFDQLVAGDSITFSFLNPIGSLGMYIITTADPVFAGDFALVTPQGTVSNSATALTTLPDGGVVYFLGLIADQTFSTATIQFDSGAVGAFFYNVDDIITSPASSVPEPATALLIGIALAFGRRRVKRAGTSP